MQKLAWYPRLGMVTSCAHTARIEYPHQTRPLWDLDGWRQKRDDPTAMSEHRPNENILQTTKMTKHPPILAQMSDCWFFASSNLSSIYSSFFLDRPIEALNHRILLAHSGHSR